MPFEKRKYATPKRLLPPTKFSGRYDKSPVLVNWEDIFGLITSDQQIEAHTVVAKACRSVSDMETYTKRKEACGAITAAAQCSGGHRLAHVEHLTGACAVELLAGTQSAQEAVFDAVKDDPHTMLCYRTLEGVQVVYRYTCRYKEVAYLDAWRWGCWYYGMLAGSKANEDGKDPNSLTWLSHDSEAVFHPRAAIFDIVVVERDTMDYQQLFYLMDAQDKVEDMLERYSIEPRRNERLSYLLQALLLTNRYGVPKVDAVPMVAKIARIQAKEVAQWAEWVYGEAEDDYGTWLMKNGYSARVILARNEMKSAEDMAELDDALGTQEGGYFNYADIESIGRYIKTKLALRHNTITHSLERIDAKSGNYIRLDDRGINELWHKCNMALGRYVPTHHFYPLINSRLVPECNPIVQYFDTLPAWDGVDYIGQVASWVTVADAEPGTDMALLHSVFADELKAPDGGAACKSSAFSTQSLFAICFRRWLVAMVASCLEPKLINQTILTFIGPQGIYKSTFFRKLLPPEMSDYFMVKIGSSRMNKDDRIALASRILIILEEIDDLSWYRNNELKALVTMEEISERAPYARHRENYPHLASFCATGNNVQFLNDTTGNRRWLPFEVERILSPYDNPLPYTQMYAQALYLFRSGYRYWFTAEEERALEGYRSHFAATNTEMEVVEKYLRKCEEGETGLFFTATDVLTYCSKKSRLYLRIEQIPKVMNKLGFDLYLIRGHKGYRVQLRSDEEIAKDKPHSNKETGQSKTSSDLPTS